MAREFAHLTTLPNPYEAQLPIVCYRDWKDGELGYYPSTLAGRDPLVEVCENWFPFSPRGLHLRTTQINRAVGDYVTYSIRLIGRQAKSVIYTIVMWFGDNGYPTLELITKFPDGIIRHYAYLRYNHYTRELAYYGTDETWHVFYTLPAGIGVTFPFRLEYAVDLENRRYRYVQFGGLRIDMSPYSYYYDVTYYQGGELRFDLYTTTTAWVELFVDSVLIRTE